MHTLAEIAARDGDAEHALRRLADLARIEDALRAFERRHEQRPPLLDAEFPLCRKDVFLDLSHIVRTLAFGDAHAVRAARDADADILLPVRRLESVHADKHLGLAVVDALQRVIE